MRAGHHRILVVEDDPETAGQIVDSLATGGYQVDLAVSGSEALRRGAASEYAVITIDRMLPDLDGIAVMRQLRDDGVATPVLIVSALGEVDDRVRGLRAGGDDYLTKPFAPDEMAARVEVLLRRRRAAAPETHLAVDDLDLDLMTRSAKRRGAELELLPIEFRLLEFLMRNSGQVLTRSMIFESVWGYTFDPGTNVIDVHIARLRRKVDPDGLPPLIHTVRGRGYCIGGTI